MKRVKGYSFYSVCLSFFGVFFLVFILVFSFIIVNNKMLNLLLIQYFPVLFLFLPPISYAGFWSKGYSDILHSTHKITNICHAGHAFWWMQHKLIIINLPLALWRLWRWFCSVQVLCWWHKYNLNFFNVLRCISSQRCQWLGHILTAM